MPFSKKGAFMKQTKRSVLIFMMPAVVLMIVIFLYPTLRTIIMSMFNAKSVTTPLADWKFVGFDNFIKLIETPLFVRSMANIGKIWIYNGIATLVLSMLFALAFTKDIRFKKFFRTIVYLPNVIDNMFLSMCIANVFGNVGYFMMMFIAGIEKIPTDYFEAASLEGATGSQRFWHIIFPLTKGVLRTAIVLWTTRTMGFFALSQVFAGVNTYTPMLFTYQTLFGTEVASESINAGMAAAAAVLMTVIVVFVSLILNRAIKDESYDM